MNANRGADYISLARERAAALWQAYEDLKSMQDEWNAQSYATTLPDGKDANAGYRAVEVGAVVFDTTNALSQLFAAGHATNITNLL